MDFGEALRAAKKGSVVARHSWEGRYTLVVSFGDRGPFLRHRRSDGLVYSDPWTPKTRDLWAEDWEIVA